VTFVDAGNRLVSARFHDAAAVSWQVVGQYGAGERDDRCYEIIGSRWLAEHQDEWAMPELRHLKLNFNLAGVLEVVCTAVTTVSKRRLPELRELLASQEPLDVLQRSLALLEHVAASDAAARQFLIIRSGQPPTKWSARCTRCGSKSVLSSEAAADEWTDSHICRRKAEPNRTP
jgi:hypothetical protein